MTCKHEHVEVDLIGAQAVVGERVTIHDGHAEVRTSVSRIVQSILVPTALLQVFWALLQVFSSSCGRPEHVVEELFIEPRERLIKHLQHTSWLLNPEP